MKSTPENKVKKAIKSYLDSLAPVAFYYSSPTASFNMPGVADIICCYRGRFISIEVKSPEAYEKINHGLTPTQDQFMSKVFDAWGVSLCVCDVEQVKNAFKSIKLPPREE